MTKTEYLELLSRKPLQTVRTVLRPMNSMNAEDYFNHIMLSCTSMEEEFKEIFLKTCRERMDSETDITLSIQLADTGTYIGNFSLILNDTEPEIGIELLNEYQRQGFGYELCRAVVDYIFENTDAGYISYVCFRNNTASLCLAAKLGAVKVEERETFSTLLHSDDSSLYDETAAGFNLIIHEIRRAHDYTEGKKELSQE